jgi:20S proteasome alpha/beta subunit
VTCIVGIVEDNIIYMGGDRAASDDVSIISMKSPKVYIRDEWIYGYAGNIGEGQWMNYINLPSPEGDVEKIVKTKIAPLLQKSIESDKESSETSFLIGAKGRLFEFSVEDWGVIEITESSIGSGSQFALGSLYTSMDNDPIDRIGLALGSAITYSPTCQGPIDILSL